MIRAARLSTALSAGALAATLLAPSAAQATVSTVTGDLAGSIRSVASAGFTLGVTHASSSLRLLDGRWVKVTTNASTTFTRAGKRVKLVALKAQDAVTARVRCAFTITNASTKIACTAIRVNATPANVVTPVQFTVDGVVAGLQANAFTVTTPQFSGDERAAVVIAALKSASPASFAVDTSTVVLLGDAAAKFSVLGVGNSVHVAVTCMSAQPFNCRATRIQIAVPKAEPVTMVGIVTLVATGSITIDVESVVQRQDSAVNVQVLKRKQMLITTVPTTPVTIAGASSTLASLVIGVRYTVSAQCRLTVPFGCVADAIKG